MKVENKIYQTLWTIANTTLRNKSIAPNSYVKKEKVLKFIASASTFIKIEKEKQIKYNIGKTRK